MISKVQIILLSAAVVLYFAGTVTAQVDCNKRPERFDVKSCCPIPELISDEIKEKCKQYNRGPPNSEEASSVEIKENDTTRDSRRQHHNHHNPCFLSCVFNETGIYVNKKLDESKLKTYLQTVLKDSVELQTTIQESFKSCAAKIDEYTPRRPSLPPPTSTSTTNDNQNRPYCPFVATKLMFCVFKTNFRNCPTSIWNDTKQCNDLREYFTYCKRPNGGPRFGPPPPPEIMEDEM